MPDGDCSVLFHVPARGLARRELREFAKRLKAEVAKGRDFCGIITSDAEMRRLNKQFRKKDYTTDVLSFPASPMSESIGDLAISWDRAKQQAIEHGHTPADEVRILMLHGVLHLTGLDHERDRGKMARAETRWRKRLNLPSGLIERVR